MESQISGADALKRIEARLGGISDLPKKRMGLDAIVLVPALRTIFQALNTDKAILLAPFIPEIKDKIVRILDEMPWMLDAFLYVSDEYARTPGAITSLSALGQEAWALRPAVMRNLDLMEAIGLIEAEDAKKVRAGRGFVDLGGDFRVMGPKFKEFWALLGPLQTRHKDPAVHLDENKIQRIIELGASIGQTQPKIKDQENKANKLEDLLRRIEVALDTDWSYLQGMLPAGYTHAGTPEKNAAIEPKLLGIQRMQAPNPTKETSSSTKEPADPPATDPSTKKSVSEAMTSQLNSISKALRAESVLA